VKDRVGLRVRRLAFELSARDEVDLGRNPGSALRGAIAAAMTNRWCAGAIGEDAEHWRRCPACFLLTGTDPGWPRGRDLPRPYAIEPGPPQIAAGERWRFSMTLIGPAIELAEALADAVSDAAARGIGRGRGRSTLIEASWVSPVGEGSELDLDDSSSGPLDGAVEELAVSLLTPLRLTDGGALVRRPDLIALMRRLLERLAALNALYGTEEVGATEWQERTAALVPVAAAAELTRDATRWVEAWSGSRRTGGVTPTGGLVGEVVWRGAIAPLVPWLRWAAAVHVGKNAVKGDGWLTFAARRASSPCRVARSRAPAAPPR
jgi:hypothetical protein